MTSLVKTRKWAIACPEHYFLLQVLYAINSDKSSTTVALDIPERNKKRASAVMDALHTLIPLESNFNRDFGLKEQWWIKKMIKISKGIHN